MSIPETPKIEGPKIRLLGVGTEEDEEITTMLPPSFPGRRIARIPRLHPFRLATVAAEDENGTPPAVASVAHGSTTPHFVH